MACFVCFRQYRVPVWKLLCSWYLQLLSYIHAVLVSVGLLPYKMTITFYERHDVVVVCFIFNFKCI